MPPTPTEPVLEPPSLPPALLQAWPVIATGVGCWLVVAAAAFLVPSLATWRPVSLAGLAVGLLGTGIFLVQRSAARRGVRGAQTGLQPPPQPPQEATP